MSKIVIQALLFLCFSAGYSQTYYVDGTAGSNSNSGLSVTSAWRTIQKAANAASPGSTIFIRGGIYHENIEIDNSGLPLNPTIFRNYASETVIIDGEGTSTSDGTALLRIDGASNVEFHNLTLRNLLCSNATGVRVVPHAATPVSNLKFKNLTIHGIRWTNNPDATPGHSDNSHPMIVYGSGATLSKTISNITIEGCLIYDNITGYSESLTISGNVDGFVIKDNEVRDNSNVGIDIGGFHGVCPTAQLDCPRNGVIKGNRTYNNISTYSTAAGIYVDGAFNVSVENNESFDNAYGIEIGCEENGTTQNIIVKNNIVYNNVVCGIYIGGFDESTTGQVVGCTVRNNTVFANDLEYEGNGEIQFSKASDCTVENNIFYTHTQQVLMSFVDTEPQANINCDYNCWFTPNDDSHDLGIFYPDVMYTSFEDYREETGQDAHSFYGNPLLANPSITATDLNLQPASPCINAANQATIISLDETAFSGISRLFGTLDIGAYEYPIQLSAGGFDVEKATVFPVPADNYVTIIGSENVENSAVISLSGRIVIESKSAQIDVSSLESGIYLLRISYIGGTTSTHKIIRR